MRVQSINYWNSGFILVHPKPFLGPKFLSCGMIHAREKTCSRTVRLGPFEIKTIAFSTFTFGFVYLFGRVPYSIADFTVMLLSSDGFRSYEYRLYSNEKYGNYRL